MTCLYYIKERNDLNEKPRVALWNREQRNWRRNHKGDFSKKQ